MQQHFAVGVNEVTRLLERMTPSSDGTVAAAQGGSSLSVLNQGRGCPPCSSATKLQAVLVASDCNSRWLIKHLPSLTSSRNVPLIYVKDNKEGSLRLGEVVKVKTAIALGVKVKANSINKLIEEALYNDKLNASGHVNTTELATVSCQ
ncbi:50S ribosomal protein L7Ae [Bienertia sinuspersici]